jgi:hypothetical protein
MQTTSAAMGLALAIILGIGAPGTCAPPHSVKGGVIDAQTAIKVWNSKPRKGETTATMERRIRQELQKMIASTRTKMEDGDRWKLLGYLRELNWQAVPPGLKQWYLQEMPNLRLTDEQRDALIKGVKDRKICQMTPKQLDVYLGYVQKEVPDLRARVAFIARKNVGQPYDMYLLGEFPYEVYDSQPLFSLEKSDCVVFSEHTYAMALSRNWKEFFANLQKIRYKNGEIGMLTRNHYTEADWDKNNSWLVKDVTNELGATTVTKYREKIDRETFFKKFGLGEGIPVEMLDDTYIPADAVGSVVDKLQDGDFVNVARGNGPGVWIGHTGLVGHGPDGKAHFIHSTPPRVTEVPIMKYVEENVKKNKERAKKGQAQFLGFKFLRLRAEDLAKQK